MHYCLLTTTVFALALTPAATQVMAAPKGPFSNANPIAAAVDSGPRPGGMMQSTPASMPMGPPASMPMGPPASMPMGPPASMPTGPPALLSTGAPLPLALPSSGEWSLSGPAPGPSQWPSGDVQYETVIVMALTTYCPESTTIKHAGKTYYITEATTLTITDCPCTMTRPILPPASTVLCTVCNSSYPAIDNATSVPTPGEASTSETLTSSSCPGGEFCLPSPSLATGSSLASGAPTTAPGSDMGSSPASPTSVPIPMSASPSMPPATSYVQVMNSASVGMRAQAQAGLVVGIAMLALGGGWV